MTVAGRSLDVPGAARPAAGDPEWLRLTRRAKRLSWTSLAWLGIEGTVSVAAGLAAGSVALVGFGIDSAIEAMASIIVIWRFSGARTLSAVSERRAQRLVAASFFLLAPYIAVDALHALIVGRHPATTWVGMALAGASLFICPWLGVAKRRVGARLGSSATAGEGRQNLLCAGLAGAVLLGLLANALWGLWWLDPAVGLIIAVVAVREGVTAWRERAAPAAPGRSLPRRRRACHSESGAAGRQPVCHRPGSGRTAPDAPRRPPIRVEPGGRASGRADPAAHVDRRAAPGGAGPAEAGEAWARPGRTLRCRATSWSATLQQLPGPPGTLLGAADPSGLPRSITGSSRAGCAPGCSSG